MARKRLKGVIKSVKNQKTLVVSVAQIKKHPKYKKRITITKKFKAHNNGGEFKVGDNVTIEESRPISKDKNWVVVTSNTEGSDKIREE